uniref:t-SNARE coiled-coil homology domain-containing protein n=1 Tax=Globisporangium ultimum (strain ATCC 200006 / CBS 805.95 / DAOM BR144) TaxID=431595 RepID=K3X8M1_GLOUD
MDRTSDFVKICVLFDTGAKKSQTHRPLSQDARRAQQIADQLRQQELFLRDLQELVTKKSIIGDDPTAQVATLTDVLKKELSAIEKNIQMFQQMIDTQRGRHQQHHQAHFTIICSSLKSRCAKSAKLFHQALQQHTAAIKERSSRRSKFSHGGASPMVHINAPLFSRTGAIPQGGTPLAKRPSDPSLQPLLGSRGPQPSGNTPSAFQSNLGNSLSANNAEPPMPPTAGLRRRAGNLGASPFMQQQPTAPGNGSHQAMQYHQRQDAQTRYQNAMQVESTIVEITGMYTRMATMVSEQGEIISRIDDNMDVASANVVAAEGELLKYYNMVTGNRSLILKIFLILLLMIFLFVVVF